MKPLFSLLCTAALIFSLAACGAQTPAASDGGSTPISEQTDAEYDEAGATAFTFSEDSIAAADGNYTGYQIDGTALTISDAGTYLLSGSCANGSVTVKKGTTGVTLVLRGLTLTSADSAPIVCGKSTEVVIVADAGTSNALADTAENNDSEAPDNENAENAVIKCKDGSRVTLCGSGALNITANGKNGIKSGASTAEEGEASLTIRNLDLCIDAPVNDAINAEQLLNVESGSLTISAADDAIHCDLTLNVGAEGTDGPAILIQECYEGLEAADLNIFSGSVTLHASDDCLNAANSDLSGYAFTLNISGGTLVMDTTSGDGIDSNGDLTISGGTVIVWTANTADNQPLDADGTISITGGTVLAAGGSAGMGMTLASAQPYVVFGSGRGGFPGGPNAQTSSADSLTLAQGDAFRLQDEGGNTLYSGSALTNACYVFFSSPDLTDGASCTLSADNVSVTSTASTEAMEESFGGPGGSGRPNEQGGIPPERPDAGSGEMPSDPPALPDGTQPPRGDAPSGRPGTPASSEAQS